MAPSKIGFTAWYDRVTSFNIESLFSRKRVAGPPRTVYVNEILPDDYLDHKGRVKPVHIYTTNQVITSKYTILTFLPRNLLEQFRRIANIYFLGIAILQFFHKFSTISPGVVILPLVIIIAITALKDGYEDVKRHQADSSVNHTKVKVLSGGEWMNPNAMETKSKTFVRGILPKGSKGQKADLENVDQGSLSHDPDIDVDYDDRDQSVFVEKGQTLPHWRSTIWEDVRVGDMVKLMNNESFPADILICATSEDENVAFVETKNLDGETNLKSRHAVPSLTHLRNAAACSSAQNSFRINCDRPDTDMYRLNGTIDVDGTVAPVDISMTLLRGTVLRNTDWAIGVVMYTGLDTKIVMNSGVTPSKRSKVERQMNPQVLINLGILALMATVCAIVDSRLETHYFPLGAPWLFADDQSDDNPSVNGGVTWAFSLLTFQDIVPISLYISIEFVRTCQAAFIYFDWDIWYEKTNTATVVRSWNLSDDLGQIEYIFSDKTGTLTQNSMVFRQCSIGGKAYRGDMVQPDDEEAEVKVLSLDAQPVDVDVWGSRTKSGSPAETDSTKDQQYGGRSKDPIVHFKDALLQEDIREAVQADPNSSNAGHARLLNGFFTVLSLCHTVLTGVDPETGAIEYKAQSPDEAALVQAAADVGFVFIGRDREVLSLRTPSSPLERYELLNILEFTSARKRMSVVLRKLDDEDGRLFLLTKGADNVIFERLKTGSDELKEATERHLSEFANGGLRTLTLAFKVINEAEYGSWSERYHQATLAMDDREAKIEAVSNELEYDLRLLGATAIEDRLQDGVPETIADLKRAGIKIWVATGDKMETAIAIGRSTYLIGDESNIIVIRGGGRPVHQQIKNAADQYFPEGGVIDSGYDMVQRPSTSSRNDIPLQRVNTGVSSIVGPENGNRPGGFVLAIDGAALLQAFSNDDDKSLLLRLAMLCEGVICCRVSPLQKSLIVKLVKEGTGAMTLAIGDGANDVSMIQAADVGVGISGEEGLQAVNSSDYAIAQFRFLKKLILVHGHWSYARNGTMILNFFYKNMVPTGILWWFQIYDGWSANYVMDYTYILFWNSIWTIAPVVGLGLFDRMLDARVLMELPELYHYGRNGRWFGIRSFFVYTFDGIVQSAIIYFLIHYTYSSTPTARHDGFDVYLYELSTTMAIAAVMVANIFTGFTATAWTAWLFFAVFIGIIIVWAYTIIYSAISPASASTNLYGNYYLLLTSPYFWFGVTLTFILALAPRYLYKAYKFGYAPDDIDIVRWIRKNDPYRDLHTQLYPGISAGGAQDPTTPVEMVRRPESRMTSRSSFTTSGHSHRPPMDLRSASMTDMSTGITSVDRGFDFATEEHGVAMRRMQTNLSERRSSSRRLAPTPEGRKRDTLSKVFSLRHSLTKRKAHTPGRSQ